MDELFGLKMKLLNGVLHVMRDETEAIPPRMTEALQRERGPQKRCFTKDRSSSIQGDCVSERERKSDKT